MVKSRQTISNAPVEMSTNHPGIKITSANDELQTSNAIHKSQNETTVKVLSKTRKNL